MISEIGGFMLLNSTRGESLRRWAELAGFAAAAAAALLLELSRHPEYREHRGAIFAYTPDPETTWVGLAILVAPMIWWLGGRRAGAGSQEAGVSSQQSAVSSQESGVRSQESDVGRQLENSNQPAAGRRSLLGAWCLSGLLLALHVALTAAAGRAFDGMPPAYHDEYSYLFQAQTFLAGRLYFPTHQKPEFFDQMHVLNDNGVFASRYFPGVGLWLMPWLALGKPYWGHYLAGGLTVSLVFWIGRELGLAGAFIEVGEETEPQSAGWANAIGFLAGLFCAVFPAMLLFGNLLLSHHPTTLALAAFVLSYLRALRSERLGWPVAGGVALACAMLCRPLTAFGFAVPFGLHLAWLVTRGQLSRCVPRVAAALTPMLAGLVLLAGYNMALTGNPLRTPYGLYTRIYTPRHVYGFRNVTRGERHLGPKVLENYDRWATELGDLTVTRAVELSGARAVASARWSLGPVTLSWLLAAWLIVLPWLRTGWKLVAGAAAGLHAAYFPYGFDGIFTLSYVLESVIALCLVTAGVSVWLVRSWLERGRWARPVWLAALLLAGCHGPLVQLQQGIVQVLFPREYYAAFERSLESVEPPAIVFIEPDPSDRHRDLVTNSPDLSGPILRVRHRGAANVELAQQYPERKLWFCDARTLELRGGISYGELLEFLREQAAPPSEPQDGDTAEPHLSLPLSAPTPAAP
jgi:hypothetical protein